MDTIVIRQDNRARNIAIGAIVIAALTYWHFNGDLPLLAASLVPKPEDEKLRSVYSFGADLLGDMLYMVGVGASVVVSGIWSIAISLLQYLVSFATRTGKPANLVTPEALDAQTKRILATVSKALNDLDKRIAAIETKPVATAAQSEPPTARKPRTRKAQP